MAHPVKFPHAPQTDVVLAVQRDQSYESQVVTAVEDAVEQLLCRRDVQRFRREIQFLGEFLYNVLTTGRGLQSLGEEYCSLLQVTECGRPPSSLRRGLFVLCKVVVPYVIDRLSKQDILSHLYAPIASPAQGTEPQDSSVFKMPLARTIYATWRALRIWCQGNSDQIQKVMLWLSKGQMAFFYVSGCYYLMSHRVTQITLFDLQGLYHNVPQFYFLGLLLLLQLPVSLLDGGSWTSQRTVVPKLPVVVWDNGSRPIVDRAQSSSDAEVSQRHRSNCALCLDPCSCATSIPCGHVFCWRCIAEWVKERERCPLCRASASLQSMLPVQGADF